MPENRYVTVDILRGLALLLMVPANMSAFVYAEPHVFWFRSLSSLAAPIFIALAGAMIALGSARKNHHWRYYWLRGFMLLVTASLLDLFVWGLWPSYDVLYLIGLACPLIHFFSQIGRTWQCAVIATLFLATPILQWQFGYEPLPSEMYLFQRVDGAWQWIQTHPASVLKRIAIDGWFPLFPWLGVGCSGALVARLFMIPGGDADTLKAGFFGLGLAFFGGIVWWVYPGEQFVRGGYSELFYPPTIGFVISAIGVILILASILHRTSRFWGYGPLVWLGECSLLVYIVHLPIIVFLIYPRYPNKNLMEFLGINLWVLLFLIGFAYCMRQWKMRWSQRPFLFRFILGG